MSRNGLFEKVCRQQRLVIPAEATYDLNTQRQTAVIDEAAPKGRCCSPDGRRRPYLQCLSLNFRAVARRKRTPANEALLPS